MSNAVKKGLPKVGPLLSRQAADFIRKRRIGSQRTIDTNCNSQQQKQQSREKLNEQQLLRQVSLVMQTIDSYSSNLLKKKKTVSQMEQLRNKQITIQRLTGEIGQIEDEVERLKQIYNRPKAFTPASQYTQLHLKQFTLADELSKQRKHLELHITQHAKIKNQAENLHKLIKETLPKYAQCEEEKGLKPMSYGDFRKKAIMQKKEKELKERIRSISSRSSNRSRSTSIRSIISGKGQQELIPAKRTMWHMQRRKSVAERARQSCRKRYEKQRISLQDQLAFLRQQDENLNIKIDELTQELASLQSSILFSGAVFSRRTSKQHL